MSEPTDLDIGPETPELDVELGPRPATMLLEIEFSSEELKRIRRGIGRETAIIQFIKSCAIQQADRLAAAEQSGPKRKSA